MMDAVASPPNAPEGASLSKQALPSTLSLPSEEEVYRAAIAALRSGEFPQAREVLRRGDSYCVIGVFCETARRMGYVGEWFVPRMEDHSVAPIYWYRSNTGSDDSIRDRLPDYFLDDFPRLALIEDDLMAFNDEGMTFAGLADAAEAGLGLSPVIGESP